MSFIMPAIAGIMSLFGGGGGGGSSSDAAQQQQQQEQQARADAEKQAKAEAAMRASALRRAAPDVQAQTGGSLTDAPFASLTQSVAGEPGNLQEALRALGMSTDNFSQQPGLSMAGGS